MGLFDWLGGGKQRRSTPKAPKRRRRRGELAERYLDRVARLEESERRRKAQQRTTRPLKPSDRGYDDPTVPIPKSVQREAERRFQAQRRAERNAVEQAAKAERRRLEHQARRLRMIGRSQAKYDRELEQLKRQGFTDDEIRQIVEANDRWESESYENPCRCIVRGRGQLTRRTNPALVGGLAAEITKDVVKGALASAAGSQINEWRQQAQRRRRRRNPARLEPTNADPKLRAMSERFHGRPDQILHLDEDQRRPPPKHVVLIGQERATVYRTPRSSERSGADWEHEAGDRGMLRRNASGRRLLVADEHGRVYLLQGNSSMRFDPDQGLVG